MQILLYCYIILRKCTIQYNHRRRPNFWRFMGSEKSKLFIKILLFINRLFQLGTTQSIPNDSLFDVVNVSKSVLHTGHY